MLHPHVRDLGATDVDMHNQFGLSLSQVADDAVNGVGVVDTLAGVMNHGFSLMSHTRTLCHRLGIVQGLFCRIREGRLTMSPKKGALAP